MKNSYSIRSRQKNLSPRELSDWMNQRRAELSLETGLPWTYCTTGDRILFRPFITPDMEKESGTAQQQDQILSIVRKYQVIDFVRLSALTSIPLPLLLKIVKHLTLNGSLNPDVDRSGKWTLTSHKGTRP